MTSTLFRVLAIFFYAALFVFQESRVTEELGIFERHWQIPRQKLLRVIHLFFPYDPWRRGKQGGLCF